jgi:hypothetical protein
MTAAEIIALAGPIASAATTAALSYRWETRAKARLELAEKLIALGREKEAAVVLDAAAAYAVDKSRAPSTSARALRFAMVWCGTLMSAVGAIMLWDSSEMARPVLVALVAVTVAIDTMKALYL